MVQFSVIVPAWNAEKTLPLCLEALEQQTVARERYEIIVIDDGSTDRTAEIARQFPVTCYVQKNQGPAMARNKGVELAEGGLIFFTDADCVPDPEWLEEMASSFAETEVAAVQGSYRTEQKSLAARFSQIEFVERYAMLAEQDSIDMISTYSAGFKKEIFQKLAGFDTRFPKADNEDTEFSYRMAEQGYTMVFTPRAVVRHLHHSETMAGYCRLKFSRGFWRMMVYRMFPGKMVKDSYTPQSLKCQIIALFCSGMSLLLMLLFPLCGAAALSISLLFFLVQSFSFTRAAFKQDRTVGWLSPFLLALRAAAIGSGVLWAMVRMRIGPDVFANVNKLPTEEKF